MQKNDVKKLVLKKKNVRRLSAETLKDVAGGARSRTATCGTQDDYCLCRICTW